MLCMLILVGVGRTVGAITPEEKRKMEQVKHAVRQEATAPERQQVRQEIRQQEQVHQDIKQQERQQEIRAEIRHEVRADERRDIRAIERPVVVYHEPMPRAGERINKTFEYRWEEDRSPLGAHRCNNDLQCDGTRVCRGGMCEGEWRPHTYTFAPRPRKTADYFWDENRNPFGPSRCENDMHCDGLRFCNGGWCYGEARPVGYAPAQPLQFWTAAPPPVKSVDYYWDEARNPMGPNTCENDMQCDGLRVCNAGWCQGDARQPGYVPTQPVQFYVAPRPMKTVDYYWDESRNPQGSNRCEDDWQCDGLRQCADGMCQGTSRDEGYAPSQPIRFWVAPHPAKTVDYFWDEGRNPLGSNRCENDLQCDGLRVCTNGSCQGMARQPGYAPRQPLRFWAPPPGEAVRLEEQRHLAEQRRVDEERRIVEQRRVEEERRMAEQRRFEEERRAVEEHRGGKSPAYRWNETRNPRGHCSNDGECDGMRMCRGGACEGRAR